jgi:uncharacterized protein (DUF2062 family)
MAGFLKRVAAERASGEHPSTLRAIAAAVAAGVAAAVITYRLLRA